MSRFARTFVALSAAAALGCSSDDGGPSSPSIGSTAVSFEPEASPLNNAVALALQGFDEQSVTFDVVLRNASQPVTAVAVEVLFDGESLTSLGGSAGPFLTGATTVSRATPVLQEAGKLVAVFTQRDLYRGNVGSGTLGSFTLRLEGGSFGSRLSLNPTSSTLFGPGGVPLTGENFSGGNLDVRRGS